MVVVVLGAPGRRRCAFAVLVGSRLWTPKFGAGSRLGGGRIVEKCFEGSQPLFFLGFGYYRERAVPEGGGFG